MLLTRHIPNSGFRYRIKLTSVIWLSQICGLYNLLRLQLPVRIIIIFLTLLAIKILMSITMIRLLHMRWLKRLLLLRFSKLVLFLLVLCFHIQVLLRTFNKIIMFLFDRRYILTVVLFNIILLRENFMLRLSEFVGISHRTRIHIDSNFVLFLVSFVFISEGFGWLNLYLICLITTGRLLLV